MTLRSLFLLVLSVSLAGTVMAQGTGRIEGRVVNGDRGIGGVAVQVVQTNDVVLSDDGGVFVVESLPPGNYTLLLRRGDDSLTRIVPVKAGETASLEIDVDWTVGRVETVKVTAGAARAEKIVDAPAAVTIVSEEQIEREASHGQLPKVLEYTPGAEVTQSGLYDFNFNTRGFNSSLNRRVSTYIDGRDVGVPLLGAQEWSALSIPLDDLAGLEFIRGPSAALYGANASSGVVQMTTKAPRESEGGMVRTSGGELNTLNLDVRWADKLAKGWYYKVVAGFRDSGDFSIERDPDAPGPDGIPDTADDVGPDNIQGTADDTNPEYSIYCDRVGETLCLQQERPLVRFQDNDIRFGTLRLDKYFEDDSRLTIETATTSIKGPVFQTGVGRVQIVDVQRPWVRVAYAHPRWNILGHWANRDGHQVNMSKGLETDFDLYSDTLRYGVEAQTNLNFAGDRGRFVIGAAHTKEEIDSVDPNTGKQTVVFKKIESDRQAIFSQVDWTQNEHIKLVFAGRVDWNTLHDTQFSPKAALVYSINPAHSLRFTVNEAFQVANYSEFFLQTKIGSYKLKGFAELTCQLAQTLMLPIGSSDGSCLGIDDNAPIIAVGNDDLKLEQTQAFEIGYSAILWRKAFLTVDYYNSSNEDFITDLIPQINSGLGNPINPDYPEWKAPEDPNGPDAEDTVAFIEFGQPVTVADLLRRTVEQQVGDLPFGFQLAQDFDGNTVVVARTYANVGEVKTQGVDFGLNLFFNDNWNIQTSYSWFDFDIKGQEVNIGSVDDCAAQTATTLPGATPVCILLPNSPEHKASLAVSYRKPKWDVSVSGRWVDGFPWTAGVFAGDVPAYWTTDISAAWRPHEQVSVGLNVANATDNIHRQTFGGDFLGRRALANLAFFW